MTTMRTTSKERGFTLIELLVVVAIIGLLSSVVLGSLKVARDRALQARIQEERRSLQNAFAIFYSNHGYYPDPGTDARICIAQQPCFDAGLLVSPTTGGDFALLDLPSRDTASDQGLLAGLGIVKKAQAALGGLLSTYPANSPEIVVYGLKYSGPMYSCNRNSSGKCAAPTIVWTTKDPSCDKGAPVNNLSSSNGTLCHTPASGDQNETIQSY
jgi:prepilin-type N-terminal cleavage/methylation domain-containing protein